MNDKDRPLYAKHSRGRDREANQAAKWDETWCRRLSLTETDRQTDRRRHYASNIEKGLSGRIATATPSPIESSAAATNALRIYRVDQNKCSV